jgi:hypothetical protein
MLIPGLRLAVPVRLGTTNVALDGVIVSERTVRTDGGIPALAVTPPFPPGRPMDGDR